MRVTGLLAVGLAACSAALPASSPVAPRASAAAAPPPPARSAPSAGSATGAASARPRPTSSGPEAGAPQPPRAKEPSGAIGTPHPLVLEDAAPDAGWVALCQARADDDGDGRIEVRVQERGVASGDRLRLYLVRAEGEGAPIDALLARSASGRHLVLWRSGRALLLDALTGVERELEGADVRQVEGGARRHRAFDFDASGERLAWLQRRDGRTAVVVSSLGSTEERRIDAGVGDVLGVRLEPLARWVVVDAVAEDANGNGRLDWPRPSTPVPTSRCALPVPALRARGGAADPVVWRAARLEDAAMRDVPGLVAPLGAGLLVRDPTGALLRERDGQRVELAPAACAGRVVHLDAARELVVVGCASKAGRATLHLAGRGALRDLVLERQGGEGPAPLTLALGEPDRAPEAPSRLLALHAGQQTALLDLETGALHSLAARSLVPATHGARALVIESSTLVIAGPGASDRHVVGEIDPVPDLLASAEVAVVTPWVVDLGRGEVVGLAPRRPLAVSRDGRVLVAEGGDVDAGRLALGPARWLPPGAP